MNTALLLLEIQNDYFQGGRLPLESGMEASLNAQMALEACRKYPIPILHIQHISTQPTSAYFLPCTKGVEFHPNVQPLKNEIIIKKHYANSFQDTLLLTYLTKNKIKHLIIAGMTTQSTVDATVRAAYDLHFNVTILHDACAAQALSFNHFTIPAQQVHHAFLASLQSNYANILSTEKFLEKVGSAALETA